MSSHRNKAQVKSEELIIILIIQYYNENDPVAYPLTLALAHSLARPPVIHSRSPFLSFFSSHRRFLSFAVALIHCTWWSKSGNSSTRAFCQTYYGTSAVSLVPLHPIMRPVSSLVPLSLCLRVSVLIRHFVDTRIRVRHTYTGMSARARTCTYTCVSGCTALT